MGSKGPGPTWLISDRPEWCTTLWPEWAHAVCWLGKRIENRPGKPWAKLIGQRVGIHAGAYIGGRKGRPAEDEGMVSLWRAGEAAGIKWGHWSRYERIAHPVGSSPPIVTGAIICTAIIARCQRNHSTSRLQCPTPPWGNPDSPRWWHLEDVEVLPEPVPCKGKQGFWRWAA